MYRLIAILALVFAVGCSGKQKKAEEAAPPPAEETTEEAAPAPEYKGSPLTIAQSDRVLLKDIVADPSAYEGKLVRVHGTAQKICKKKGCWMVLADDGVEEGVRVTFKDYGFFVDPNKDIGRTVHMEARVSLKTVTVAALEHRAEEQGEKIDAATLQPEENVLNLDATGIALF